MFPSLATTSSSIDAFASARNRRRFLAVLSLAGVGAAVGVAPLAAGAQESAGLRKQTALQAPKGIEQLATRTRVVLQLSGELQVADPNPASKNAARTAEVKAESTVDFDERALVDSENQMVAAARHYHQASVNTWVAGNAISHQLRSQCANARLVRQDGVWQQYAIDRPMLPREIDLVRLPINSVVLDQLLPPAPVKADESWTPPEKTVCEVFQLEAVHSSTVTCRVVKAESGVATIECIGDIQGTVNNVPTKINVNGNLQAELASRCAMVTWLGMSLTETREISQAEPGFRLTARVKLIRQEDTQACREVTAKELAAIAASNDNARWLVQIASVPGRYQMLADRRWKTIVDTGEEAIVRLVEKNQIVAQCNITRLPKLAAGQQLSLAGFQDEIKRGLDTNLDSLVDASEKRQGSLRVLRVSAVGKTQEVPVRWVYAHLSDDSGRRVSMVFTMSGQATEKFGMDDEQMISSFELLPETSSQSPTPVESAARPADDQRKR